MSLESLSQNNELKQAEKEHQNNSTPTARPIIGPKAQGSASATNNEQGFDLWIRVGYILDPMDTTSAVSRNPLNINGVVNDVTYKCVIRWADLGGGVYNPEQKGKREETEKSYNTDDRTMSEKSNTSTKEIVPITSPFIWTGTVNWCGINFIPPVGSKVLVGFGKNRLPVVLGYLAEHYAIVDPPCEPGEILIKGYGNNYIHWHNSNKLTISTYTKEGAPDRDDKDGGKTASANSVTSLEIDADNGFISLMVNSTGIRVSESSITLSINGTSIQLTDDAISLQTPSQIMLNASQTDINSATISLHGQVSHNG